MWVRRRSAHRILVGARRASPFPLPVSSSTKAAALARVRCQVLQHRGVFGGGGARREKITKDYWKDKVIVYQQDISDPVAKQLLRDSQPEGLDLNDLDNEYKRLKKEGLKMEAAGLSPFKTASRVEEFSHDSIYVFQHKHCPRSRQVRAFLDYLKITYIAVEVTPYSNKELEMCSSEMRKVPMVRVDNQRHREKVNERIKNELVALLPDVLQMQVLTDDFPTTVEKIKQMLPSLTEENRLAIDQKLDDANAEIAVDDGVSYFPRHDTLQTLVDWARKHKYLPSKKFTSEEALERVDWVNERLRPLLMLCTCRSLPRTWQLFTYVHDIEQWSWAKREWLHHWGGIYMRFRTKYMLKNQLGMKGRIWFDLYDDFEWWLSLFEGKPFHGGAKPDLADIMVYGALKAFEDLDIYDEVIRNTEIEPWLTRMADEVEDLCQMEMGVP